MRLAICLLTVLLSGAAWTTEPVRAAEPKGSLFARDNLVAWCVVPFDAKQRGPEARAEMLDRLGFRMLAYDWRAQHVPAFEEEILAMKGRKIDFFAHWCSGGAANPANQTMARLAEKHDIRPQMWLSAPAPKAATESRRIEQAAEQLKATVQWAKGHGLKVGLYNHGGWSGEPETMTALSEYFRQKLDADNVGIIYNFHHGHTHLDRFPKAFEAMVPYLLCVNLNGMDPDGPKILALGQGSEDLKILEMIRDSGYRGPIGILDHRADLDTETSLRENLDGLKKLLEQLGDEEALRTYR